MKMDLKNNVEDYVLDFRHSAIEVSVSFHKEIFLFYFYLQMIIYYICVTLGFWVDTGDFCFSE